MGDMSQKADELAAEIAAQLLDTMSKHSHQMFEQVVRLDDRLTQNNFLTNAGGAAATLAFIGAQSGNENAVVPLGFFVLGLIAAGAEVRALLKFASEIHKGISSRRIDFAENKISVEECLFEPGVRRSYRLINDWSGWISQGAFAIGAIVGGALLVVRLFS